MFYIHLPHLHLLNPVHLHQLQLLLKIEYQMDMKYLHPKLNQILLPNRRHERKDIGLNFSLIQ
jgi:hypothetical protein